MEQEVQNSTNNDSNSNNKTENEENEPNTLNNNSSEIREELKQGLLYETSIPYGTNSKEPKSPFHDRAASNLSNLDKPEDFRSDGSIHKAINLLAHRLPHVDCDFMDVLTRYLTIKSKTTKKMVISVLAYFGLSANSLSFLASMIIDYEQYDIADFAILKRSKNILEHCQIDFHVIRLYIYFYLYRSIHSYVILPKQVRVKQIYALRRKYRISPSCSMSQALGCVYYSPPTKSIASNIYSLSKPYAECEIDRIRHIRFNSIGGTLSNNPKKRVLQKELSDEICKESLIRDQNMNDAHTLNSKELGYDPQQNALFYKWDKDIKQQSGFEKLTKVLDKEKENRTTKATFQDSENEVPSSEKKNKVSDMVLDEDENKFETELENEKDKNHAFEADNDYMDSDIKEDKLLEEIEKDLFDFETDNDEESEKMDINLNTDSETELEVNNKTQFNSLSGGIRNLDRMNITEFGDVAKRSVNVERRFSKLASTEYVNIVRENAENIPSELDQIIPGALYEKFDVLERILGFLMEHGNEMLLEKYGHYIEEKCKRIFKVDSLKLLFSKKGFSKSIFVRKQMMKLNQVFPKPELVKILFEEDDFVILFEPETKRQYSYLKPETRKLCYDRKRVLSLHSYKKTVEDPYIAIDLVGIAKKLGPKLYTLCTKCGNVTDLNLAYVLPGTSSIHCQVHKISSKSLSNMKYTLIQNEKYSIYSNSEIASEMLFSKPT